MKEFLRFLDGLLTLILPIFLAAKIQMAVAPQGVWSLLLMALLLAAELCVVRSSMHNASAQMLKRLRLAIIPLALVSGVILLVTKTGDPINNAVTVVAYTISLMVLFDRNDDDRSGTPA